MRDLTTSLDLSDKIQWCKFSQIEFNHECNGFYYCCYSPPKGDADAGTETEAAKNQRVMYHTINTPAEDDVLVYCTPDQPDWMFGAQTTHDGKYLLITNNDSPYTIDIGKYEEHSNN